MPAEEFKKTMALAVADALHPLGFNKSATKFIRTFPGVAQIVSLQSSISSSSALFRVTANLGIWVSDLAGEGEKPDILTSHWRMRIGQLMPDHLDYWWEMSSDEEAGVAALALGEALRNYVRPVFDELTTTAALEKLWRSGKSPGLTEVQRQRFMARLDSSRNSKS
jgi:hypothetical protein